MSPALLLALLLLPAAANAAEFSASGQFKNLYETGRSSLNRKPYRKNTTRARVELEASQGPVRARVDYDHELFTGSYLRSLEYRKFGLAEPPGHFDLEQNISSGTDGLYRHRLYRGWIEARGAGMRLRFGRQRIAWGTGKLWNPVDVLNPYQPTSLEREERRGVDSLHASRALGALGQIEAAYTLADRWKESDFLARVRGNFDKTDLSLIGGHVAASTGSWMAGGAWSSDLEGGNFHGEWSIVDLKIADMFFRGMAGYEYTFSADPFWAPLKDVWVVAEYLYNGKGRGDFSRYDFAQLATGREVSVARHYLGTGITKEFHPLVKGELYALFNADDGSQFFAPSVSYNPVGELHLSAGWQRFGGGRNSEFGRRGNIGFVQGQWFW
ncbi:MAG: hypothetical protein AUJ52_11470 [Elusimicrobia bacterium CG1_02_63_36]|nr:MAG: hypothetical protein AUJ52_11470 [Elusimicrobia bacterium CG1_02_63_36]